MKAFVHSSKVHPTFVQDEWGSIRPFVHHPIGWTNRTRYPKQLCKGKINATSSTEDKER